MRRITFRHNFCRVTNTQAILAREFSQAKVIGNVFTGPVRYRAILLENGATQAEVLDNVFQGPFRPYEIDESSRPSVRAERNVHLQ